VTVAVVERWVETPLRHFVQDAQVTLALLLTPSGQVLGQHGFTRAMDVMAACALAAAIHASSAELGKLLEGKPFAGLHHAGATRQIFLAPAETRRGTLLCLTVFDEATSIGIVQLYFGELQERLAAGAPGARTPPTGVLADSFEQDLNRNLTLLFRR
jgi:hypothetical protein